jgi:TM2 domain-containing membrane protein YozV
MFSIRAEMEPEACPDCSGIGGFDEVLVVESFESHADERTQNRRNPRSAPIVAPASQCEFDDVEFVGDPMSGGLKSCPFCAEKIAVAAIKCKHCGSVLNPMAVEVDGRVSHVGNRIFPSNTSMPPSLMLLVNLCCLAGLGQIVLGQTVKGVFILLVSMVLAVLTGGLSIIVTWPMGAIDAFCIAKKLKDGRSVGQWEFF